MNEIHADTIENALANRKDYYSEFLNGSGWLKREQIFARAEWFADLSIQKKEQTLFEFEMLLKGLVCLANPANNVGLSALSESPEKINYHTNLKILQQIIFDLLEYLQILGATDKGNTVWKQYLDKNITQDHLRFYSVKKSLVQDVPNKSLTILRITLNNILEITIELVKMEYISRRSFLNIIFSIQREIQRSNFFDSLGVMSFRQEFDKVKSPTLINTIDKAKSDPARRVFSMVIISFNRLLRHAKTIDDSLKKKVSAESVYGWMTAMRSDIRALHSFLHKDCADWLSTGFLQMFDDEPSQKLKSGFAELEKNFIKLKSFKDLLVSMGDQLKLEQKKIFDQQIPLLSEVDEPEFKKNVRPAMGTLKTFFQNTIVLIAKEFDPDLSGLRLFNNFVPASVITNRLRRDIWMFIQVLRAFIAKSKSASNYPDLWTGSESLSFIKDFTRYFRSLGYHLLRYSDYNELDRFIEMVDKLKQGDALKVQRLPELINEFENFLEFLQKAFESVSKRAEVKNTPFDAKDAALTLKQFLSVK